MQVCLLLLRVFVGLCEDHGILDSLCHQFVDECALLSESVLMLARYDHHYVGICLQARLILLGTTPIGQHQEDGRRVGHRRDIRHGIVGEDRKHIVGHVHVFLQLPSKGVEINDVALSLYG